VDIAERIAAVTVVDPAAPAIAQDGRFDTWSDVAAIGKQLDQAMADIPPDAAIGLVTRNQVAVLSTLLCLLARRRGMLTLNELQPDAALAEEITTLRPAVVVLVETDWSRPGIAAAAAAAGARVLVVDRGPDPTVRTVAEGTRADGYARLGGDCAVCLKTSGTTGPPKRIEISYRSLSASITAVESHHKSKDADVVRLRPGVTIQMLALAHTSAIQTICTTVAAGRQLALLERFKPVDWAEAVRDYQVVTTGIPPSAIRMVLDADIPPEWLSSLKAVRAGSAPLSPAVAAEFESRFGVPVLQAYGATEFQGLASWTLKDHRRYREQKRGAVGRLHPGVAVRVIDPDSGDVLPTGSDGVLEVRTVQSANGTGSEWIRTSDLARYDDDGFLWILGRVDGAINRGGFKVDANQVAETLREHPAVRDAAVVGLPDTRLGEVPVAVVTLAGTGVPAEDELKGWVRGQLEPYKVPTRIAVVDEIPVSIAMKPDRTRILALLSDTPAAS
jgi:acyl-CoA synthetase (AMP-forming)/AMP-acid ligase II